MAEDSRYAKYKESLDRARDKYLEGKRKITVVVDSAILEEFKAVCDSEGISMQGYLKDKIREKLDASQKNPKN